MSLESNASASPSSPFPSVQTRVEDASVLLSVNSVSGANTLAGLKIEPSPVTPYKVPEESNANAAKAPPVPPMLVATPVTGSMVTNSRGADVKSSNWSIAYSWPVVGSVASPVPPFTPVPLHVGQVIVTEESVEPSAESIM